MMTTEYVFAISRRDAPEFCRTVVPPGKRGRREDRVHAAPAVSCARCTKQNAHEHTGSAETLRPSPRNGFTAYSALSSVTGLSCHRRSREALASQELDTSVGVSGPHDFAVRVGALVLCAIASTASRLAFRDDCAYAPPVRRDGASW